MVLYAASAWWGFTSASDRQRIEAFVGRAKRCGFCYADQPPVSSLVEDADDKLFEYVLTNPEHSLSELLPDRRHELKYSLRPSGIISRLVVDHIAYLTAISLLGYSLKTLLLITCYEYM